MTPLQTARRLYRLAKTMTTLGVAMDYHGGFSETGQHGGELLAAGETVKGWAIGIEAEHRARRAAPPEAEA